MVYELPNVVPLWAPLLAGPPHASCPGGSSGGWALGPPSSWCLVTAALPGPLWTRLRAMQPWRLGRDVPWGPAAAGACSSPGRGGRWWLEPPACCELGAGPAASVWRTPALRGSLLESAEVRAHGLGGLGGVALEPVLST